MQSVRVQVLYRTNIAHNSSFSFCYQFNHTTTLSSSSSSSRLRRGIEAREDVCRETELYT